MLSDEDQDLISITLEEGVLNINVGMPVIIACNKSDLIGKWQQDPNNRYDFDWVMRHIRQFALMFGASVFSVSSLKNRGLETLYKYVLHRLYDFDFPEKPELRDEESIVIPSGFDNPALVK